MYDDGKQEVFAERLITSNDLTVVDEEEKIFEVRVGREEIPRTKEGGSALVVLYAWMRERVVSRWELGNVQV